MKVLTTGIGSLPYQDAEKALDLIFRYCPNMPFWPQLPKRSPNEGMIAQFSENLPCFGTEKEKKLEAFYDRIIHEDKDYFKLSPDFAAGFYAFVNRLEKIPALLSQVEFIKCHVTGPFTFAAGVNDENGVALLYNEIFMQVILKGLSMKAAWQISLLRKFGKKIIIFFDEPYLGCFGSAYTPITREKAIAGLTEIAAAVKAKDVLTGVHCCGNTDWSIFTDVSGIDIINFDAYNFFERLALYVDDLKGFFGRGGMLCWGIVPTQEFSAKDTPEALSQKIREGINLLVNKGLDKELLVKNLLLSPACGLGTLLPQQAEQIFQALSGTAKKIV